MSPIDDSTIYPYQQLLHDLKAIQQALVALQKNTPDREAVLTALAEVGEKATGRLIQSSLDLSLGYL